MQFVGSVMSQNCVLQITIDTTPPTVGSVIDALPGQTDKDYQSSDRLDFSWSGFFDRESGIMWYKYAVSDECIPMETFLTDDPMVFAI